MGKMLSGIKEGTQIISAAQERLAETAGQAPEMLKETAMNTVGKSYELLRGSGSVLTELHNAKDAALNLPISAAGAGLKAGVELLTLHPFKATGTLAKGLMDSASDIAQLGAAPIAASVAVAEKTLKTAGNIALAPGRGVLKGFGVVKRGCGTMLDMIKGNNFYIPPSSSSAGSAESTMPMAA